MKILYTISFTILNLFLFQYYIEDHGSSKELYKVSVNNGKFIICQIEKDKNTVSAVNCSNGMNYYNSPLTIGELK